MRYSSCLVALVALALCACNRSNQVNELQKLIDEGLKSGKQEIVIPAGEYRVAPHQRSHLTLNGVNDVTIDATGVKMICLETTRAITLSDCENVTIKGLTIDYDPLCFTQGHIIGLSEDKKVIDFRIDNGYPDNLEERIEIFDQNTKELKRNTYYGWKEFQKISDRTYRVEKGDDYVYNPSVDTEEIGDILVTNNTHVTNGSMPHAVYSDNCKNLLLKDITLYSGNCFAFFETNGTRNTYLRCKVKRCPPEQDYTDRPMRIRSNNADAFHSKFAHVGPQLIQCEASFQGDDGLNICGRYFFSLGASEGCIRIVPLGECDLTAGDTIEVVTYDGERLPLLCVKSISEGGKISAEELERIKTLPSNDNIKAALLNPENQYQNIVVDKVVDFELGAVVGNRDRMGNGFLVKDCNFSFNRSRGVLIKASNGMVVNNVFEGNWISSILVTPETWWLESGCSDNVFIEGNRIIGNKRKYAINVSGSGYSQKPAPAGLHCGITVKNNEFENCLSPMIRFQSVKGGELVGNHVLESDKRTEAVTEIVNCD